MRWTRFHVVRLATLFVPCAWFTYVLTTFTLGQTSFPAEDLQVPGVRSQRGVQLMQADQHVGGKDSANRAQVKESKAFGNHSNVEVRVEQRLFKSVPIVAKEAIQQALRGNAVKILGKAVKFPKRQQVTDDMANVTYPPYVEYLPPGAEGQGPKGMANLKEELLPKDKRQEFKAKWQANSFNQFASDLIPVHRDLPDVRPTQCRERQYPADLPRMSVVIIFHNEAWSVLLRSVHSILDRTKAHLLQEIILVDDFSDMDHLQRPLDKYFRNNPKVKIIRSEERGGLTRARLLGAKAATGDVLIFLDSHIECTTGWAEPLLAVIAQDYRAVPFPIIDIISATSLAYVAQGGSAVGGMSLHSLTFIWTSMDMHVVRTRPTPPDTKPSPTMPGGLFAISRRWFEELGGYDPGLKYWGGENMELSFKIWMCNGSLLVAECSHIGHIFRSSNPITWPGKLGHSNYLRVALVWMDGFKDHYLERINYDMGNLGDISDRVELRRNLGCRSFGWYVDNIYPELKEQMVLNAMYAGSVKHDASGQCLDKMALGQAGPQLFPCHNQGANQFWYLANGKHMMSDSMFICKDAMSDKVMLQNTAADCDWQYEEDTKRLRHMTSNLCLQKRASEAQTLTLQECSSSHLQRWTFDRRKAFRTA